MKRIKASLTERSRYGIGEWYGKSFANLTPDERKYYAEIQLLPKRQRPPQPCIPHGCSVPCSKEGGVCSIRLYKMPVDTNEVTTITNALVTTCPYRFEEDSIIYRWIGDTILGHSNPDVVKEIGFLERNRDESNDAQEDPTLEDVGRIDNVLVHPSKDPMVWCALEIQAVYFSGSSMSKEFTMLREWDNESVPFPAAHRRPDYRSSGPKRLMPQLQIKVPSLRRWGKKMAVVVDNSFFQALGSMTRVKHVSNADVAWFVMKYNEEAGEARLEPYDVYYTTLESAVDGLTAGNPVSLEVFESRIQERLKR